MFKKLVSKDPKGSKDKLDKSRSPTPTPAVAGNSAEGKITKDMAAIQLDKHAKPSAFKPSDKDAKKEIIHANDDLKEVKKDDTKPQKKLGLQDIIIDRTLGTGSFGRVHLIRIRETGKFHAMKVLSKASILKMRQLEHTINERAVLSKCNHPFLVSLAGTFQDVENVYFVLEYIQGGELFTYLRKYVRFPNNVARFYAAQVVLAFEHLHSKSRRE